VCSTPAAWPCYVVQTGTTLTDHRAIHIVVREPALAVEELRAFRTCLPRFGEVWVERADGSQVCALVSSRSAWLMYLRHEGDPGFSTRNSRYSGPSDAMVEFMLGNGQMDRYPAAWTYPTDVILLALERFAVDGVFPTEIDWYDDSADGVSPPVAL